MAILDKILGKLNNRKSEVRKPKVRKPKVRKPKVRKSSNLNVKINNNPSFETNQKMKLGTKTYVKNGVENGNNFLGKDLIQKSDYIDYDEIEAKIISYVLNNKGLPRQEVFEKSIISANWETGEIVFYELKNLPKNISKFIRKSQFDFYENKNLKFTEEDAINALRKAATYYFPLSSKQYDHLRFIGEIVGPRSRWIEVKMNGWINACIKAGIESPMVNKLNYNIRWSDDELWKFFERYYLDPETTGIRKNYDEWRIKQPDEIPSSTVLKQRLGDWDTLREELLQKIYDQRK